MCCGLPQAGKAARGKVPESGISKEDLRNGWKRKGRITLSPTDPVRGCLQAEQ